MSVRPTNSWFENFMVESGRLPVHSLPYLVRSAAEGLDVCYPNLDTTSYNHAVIANMTTNISLRSTAGALAPKLTSFTDLGCTLTWSAGMTADVVRGAAYATMKYTAVTPVVTTVHAILTINGTSNATTSFTGTKFKLAMNNGQTWILYTSSSVTLNLSATTTLTASAPFTGTFRVAILPSDTGAEAVLDAGAPRIHTGGSALMEVSSDGALYRKTFNFTSTGTGNLLTYSMPHHQDNLVSPIYSGLTLTGTMRGTLKAVTGVSWVQELDVVMPSWNNKNPIRSDRLAAIQSALATDKAYIPTAYPFGINDTIADPYFGAKWQAKSARLALIADQVGDTAARDQLLGNLKTVFSRYLQGNDPGTKLRYETNWGGIVSEKGLTNNGVDFGNGVFNDHYFHYGYMIYAAAVIGKYDATWLATYKPIINDLVRDIANPVNIGGDTYFPPFRHFDHFEGHSWASGILEASQSNQESTSEAVNAWYGLYLWGLVSNQPRVADLGRALYTEETLTAWKYWQIIQAHSHYPANIKAYGCIGIVWSFKYEVGTWFSSMTAQLEHVHGIQILPITPATEALVRKEWITETWPNNLAPLTSRTPAPTSEWWSVLYAAYSHINPNDAWTKAQTLTAYDDGLSKTQLLYHIATQV